MTAGPSPHARACAVCGNVVNELMTDGKVTWIHDPATVDDHPVVAVLVEEIQTNFRCDFCLEDNARWALPVEDFEVFPEEPDAPVGGMNAGDWAACDGCAAALRANDWNKLTYRAMRAHRARGGPVGREVFEQLYRRVRPHIKGPVQLRVEKSPKSQTS